MKNYQMNVVKIIIIQSWMNKIKNHRLIEVVGKVPTARISDV